MFQFVKLVRTCFPCIRFVGFACCGLYLQFSCNILYIKIKWYRDNQRNTVDREFLRFIIRPTNTKMLTLFYAVTSAILHTIINVRLYTSKDIQQKINSGVNEVQLHRIRSAYNT